MNKKNIKRYLPLAFILSFFIMSCQSDGRAQNLVNNNVAAVSALPTQADPLPTERRHPSKKIKIALLLDTSNSMDGLIHQAKSQLWELVNNLADAECEGMKPTIEIALYEYGNDRLSENSGYIRQVRSMTTDLDQLSEDLFGLSTDGGSEHCGQVIYTSLNDLSWSEGTNDLQVIFIAGNEPFTQGPISYKKACALAKQNNVVVNTIFCGNFHEGANTSWQSGALLTGGEYMSIDQNSKTVFIPSPYDDRIASLNQQLNDTYVYYGQKGAAYKEKQELQDANAQGYGLQNMVKRTVSKSKHIYKNSKWDLVDAVKENEVDMESISESDLNEEMKDMSTEERKAYIKEKSEKRTAIQKEISSLDKKRREYVRQEQQGDVAQLDQAMLEAIRKQAKRKNILF